MTDKTRFQLTEAEFEEIKSHMREAKTIDELCQWWEKGNERLRQEQEQRIAR